VSRRRRGVRQYDPIVNDLRWVIESGELPPGAKMPTEDELGERYDVSRGVVRNALKELRRVGVVEAKQGQGHFVVDRKPTTSETIPAGYQLRSRMPWPDEVERLGLLREGEPVVEVYYAGRLIEVSGTLHKTFDWAPAEDPPAMLPARPARPS
jgi:DNA-binding GntR family transcriptional regulator